MAIPINLARQVASQLIKDGMPDASVVKRIAGFTRGLEEVAEVAINTGWTPERLVLAANALGWSAETLRGLEDAYSSLTTPAARTRYAPAYPIIDVRQTGGLPGGYMRRKPNGR